MLKLTTDKHEASRGLSATAELLVLVGHNLHGEYLQNGSGHFPLDIFPRTFPPPGQFSLFFTWCRTFSPFTTTTRQSTI